MAAKKASPAPVISLTSTFSDLTLIILFDKNDPLDPKV